jgi:D-glycero-D-manno-heptose 1,7-bisphosphate phosphatase
MKRAVFLDRDGVINRKAAGDGYVTRWEDFHFLPGVAEAISSLDRAGWSVIVISNQRCVAKGLLTIAELEAIHQKMLEELARSGAKLDGIYYCPHDTSSWLVGDSESDIEAGKRAGCSTVRIVADLPAKPEGADCFARSLVEASERVLAAPSKLR